MLLNAVALTIPVTPAAADYPTKSIRLIVPSVPGGAPDISARVIAGELGKLIGQQVVAGNRPGARRALCQDGPLVGARR
jgi:tripartite-type tricarboxylate transporter receptor subunit TctC